MREIRFRFYDKVRNIMFNEITLIGLHWRSESDPPVYVGSNSHNYGGGRLVPHYSDGAVMQYTGLKDKNGKEIYEGDITTKKQGSIGIIRFHKSWGAFYFDTALGRDEDGNLVPMLSAVPMWNDWNTLEVIGNIYENPELLKEETT